MYRYRRRYYVLTIFFETTKSERWWVKVDAQDNLGNTPLHLALLNGNPSAVKFLLVRGVCLNLANEKGETPLHIICKRAKNSNVIANEIFAIARKKRWLVLVDA
uniref:Uncharacterized protein n=1 Tax=Trichogramma kaykai TaxID=54128 RepID=A0ABD2VSU2_9HYME